MRIIQVITDYIMKSILTTHGDMVLRGATDPERLAAVAVGQVLKSGGVGAKPTWGVPSLADNGIDFGYFTTTAAESKVITGLSFTPSLLLVTANDTVNGNMNWSVGWGDLTDCMCIFMGVGGTEIDRSITKCFFLQRAAGNYISGVIAAMVSGGFTLTVSLTGTSEAQVLWLAIG